MQDAGAAPGRNPENEFLVGVDSDGCVFPSMEIKQRLCIHPLIIRHWRLQAIEPLVRETAEFVNLYSRRRGSNRFAALCLTMDLLRARPRAAGAVIPELIALRAFIASGAPLSNASLEQAAGGDPELDAVLQWSRDVDALIAQKALNLLPFPGVCESLEMLQNRARVVCVSQTPVAALEREWRAAGLHGYAAAIYGQEHGAKSEQLRRAAGNTFAPGRMLMIGDAPGDCAAARAAGAAFYPILPGREVESWRRFREEAAALFMSGGYNGGYAAALLAEFEKILPEQPSWR